MGRGRKVNSNGERSMKLLREKAIEIFSEYGYYQTKISDIVKAANVTQPTFYLYFESKEELYKDIIQEFQLNLENIFDETLQESNELPDEKSIVQQVLTNMFNFFSNNPFLTKVSLNHSNNFVVEEILPEKFYQILMQNPQYKEAKKEDLDIFIYSLIGSIERLTLTTLLTNSVTPEKLAEDIVSIYFTKEEALISL